MALAIPDIIEMLLLTYSLWAPGIIVPVIVGVFSKKITKSQNTNIFVTMVAGMTASIVFMLLDISYEGKVLKDIVQPLVVGVTFSVIVYLVMSTFNRERSTV